MIITYPMTGYADDDLYMYISHMFVISKILVSLIVLNIL